MKRVTMIGGVEMYDAERLRRIEAECAAEIERDRTRRRRRRKVLNAVLGVFGVLVMLALGAMLAIATFFQPWEVAAWFR